MTARIAFLPRAQLGAIPERVEDWLRQLAGPTLIHVPGRARSRTRVLTTLLHGDEPSGTRAVHAWLRSNAEPATSVLLYLGSVQAALAGGGFAYRMLPGTRDANRCFGRPLAGDEGRLARELLARIEAARPEALIDVHNNTGHSPAYGVGLRADEVRLGLTSLFADHYMLTDLRLGALIEATDRFVPSVVIECGRAGDPVADAVALAGLERYLLADPLPRDPARAAAGRVLSHPIRVKIRPGAKIAFAQAPVPGVDLTIRADVDRHNLEALEAGTLLGWLAEGAPWPLDARGADGIEVSAELLGCERGRLCARRSMVPVMMTASAAAAVADCLFYALERR